MRDRVAIHGLEPRQGETAFAFLVLRLSRPMERAALVEVVRHVAPVVPDADRILEAFSDDMDETMQLVGLPWMPPERGELDEQRALIERAAARGVVEAWFFQTGTRLPAVHGGDDEDEEDEGGDEEEEEDEDAAWSHGPPPQRTDVPFPVDGYPEILEKLDWEDFGIAFKLAGPFTPGESTVLLGFHALWLSPYGAERYRNTSVTVDRRHHAAHLWVDRFAVPSSPEEQVGHLLWVLSKLHEVTPVLHACFRRATMTQKYGRAMGDTSEPFVLGGNPLRAIHAERGEAGVDRWIAEQTDWSSDEVARMLCEVAEQIVVDAVEGEDADADAEAFSDDDEDDDGGELDEDDDGGELDEADDGGELEDDGGGELDEDDDGGEDDDDDDDDGELDEADDGGELDEDDEDDEDDGDDRGRVITTYARELLVARARAGLLDARAADALRPLLATPEEHEVRRSAAVGILGALQDRASVPALIQILEEIPIQISPHAIGKADLLAETAAALGAIADPAAVPALAKLVAAHGRHHDRSRPAAAFALAACLAAVPEPRDVDDALVGAMLETIRERGDGGIHAEMLVAYGQLAQQLAPARRDDLRQRLAAAEPPRDRDDAAALARETALALASGGSELPAAAAASLRALVHATLTGPGQDHRRTLQRIRLALRVAELLPELAAPDDLVGLTRFAEQDVRERAHALLARFGREVPPARCFDPRAARELSDEELVQQAGEPHVVGRAALVGEITRRDLEAGRAAVRAAVQAIVDRAPPGDAGLLAPDARLLALAIPWLREGELDDETIALFDRMLRHGSRHVKWELLEDPPSDERLVGGMFYVLCERWDWQAETARDWLRQHEGTAAFEAARRRAGVASLDEAGEGDDADDDGDDADEDDGDDADADGDDADEADDEMN